MKKKKQVEDEEVDIMTVDKISYFSSDDEDDLFFIPATIEKNETV